MVKTLVIVINKSIIRTTSMNLGQCITLLEHILNLSQLQPGENLACWHSLVCHYFESKLFSTQSSSAETTKHNGWINGFWLSWKGLVCIPPISNNNYFRISCDYTQWYFFPLKLPIEACKNYSSYLFMLTLYQEPCWTPYVCYITK